MNTGALALGPTGRPQALAEKCSTCVFRPGNPMHLAPGRLAALVTANVAAGALLTCHQTLTYGTHPEIGGAACRGFLDAHGHRTAAGRFALAVMGGFDEIPAPTTPARRENL